MAAGTTAIVDVVVPEIFTGYTQQLTEEKSRLIQSGALVLDAFLSNFLDGGGLTIHAPSWRDLDNDAENVSTDVTGTSTPNKIKAAQEIAVRLSRNQSWATADLTSALAGSDPADAIADRVAAYWTRRMQAAFVATMTGIFADNAAAPTGGEHTINDLTHDVSGSSFADGVTNFSAENAIDTALTMGDSMDSLSLILMHSVVYGRMLKNDLIEFETDSSASTTTATFLGRKVIVDDGMPVAGGVFQTWMFGPGAVRWGSGSPKVPTEVLRIPSAGNGGGQEQLYNRVEWCIHPAGHQYVGAAPMGGPSNANTTNNLANANSWMRAYSERKQVKIARLISREF